MPTVRFEGRVFPTTAGISMETAPITGWRDAARGLTMDFKVQLQDGDIVVIIDVNKFNEAEHYLSVLMRASDTARAIIDLISFSSGRGLTLILERFIGPDGVVKTIEIGDPGLAAVSTATSGKDNFTEVMKFVVSDPPLYLALRDLVEAITQFHRAPASAGRAVEALRHSIAPNETDRRKQWQAFREALRVEKSYVDVITDNSQGPRHGDPTHIPGPITSDLAKRAWIIMNRYLEFRKRGGQQPLPLSDFPPLS